MKRNRTATLVAALLLALPAIAVAGEAKAAEPSAQELEAKYLAEIGKLAQGLSVDDPSKMATADRALEEMLHRAAAPGKEAHRAAAAKALLPQLDAVKTTMGRTRVVRHLERIGAAEAVPTLVTLLSDKELREPARRALLANPAPAALAALRAALPKADKPFRMGLIDALGDRPDPANIDPLLAQAKDPDDDVRSHAVRALAKNGEQAAKAAVLAATSKGGARARRTALAAYVTLADRLADLGQRDAALAIFRALLKSKGYIRCAGLIGTGKAGSAADVDTLVAALTGDARQSAAARDGLILLPTKKLALGVAPRVPKGQPTIGAAYVPDRSATQAIAKKVVAAPPSIKAILIDVLGKRGDAAGEKVILEATKDKDETVRLAAFQAIGDLKDEAGIPACIAALHGPQSATRDKAEAALNRIPGKKATAAIVAAIRKAAAKEAKAALHRALGHRKDAETLNLFVAGAKDPEEGVRAAALRALGELNQVAALPVILAALKDERGATARQAAFYALRRTRGKEANQAILEAAKGAPPQLLGPIIQVLSWRDEPTIGAFLTANAASSDPQVQVAALDGLARFKDPKAVPAIIAAATKGQGEVRDTAVRTALRYADEIAKHDRAAAAAIFALGADRKIVAHYGDRSLALRALGQVGGPENIAAICRNLRDRRVSNDAHTAVVRIAGRLAKEGKKGAAVEAYLTLTRLSIDHRRIREAQKKLSGLGVEGELPHKAGFITRWKVCGPFPNPKNALFSKTLPPETSMDASKPVAVGGVTCQWKDVHTTDPAAIVNLEALLKKKNDGAALLYAEVTVPEAVDVLFCLGYAEGCVAYLNGKKIHSRAGSRFRIDDQRMKTSLKAGVNKILLKIVNLRPGWSVCTRLVGRAGQSVDFTQR